MKRIKLLLSLLAFTSTLLWGAVERTTSDMTFSAYKASGADTQIGNVGLHVVADPGATDNWDMTKSVVSGGTFKLFSWTMVENKASAYDDEHNVLDNVNDIKLTFAVDGPLTNQSDTTNTVDYSLDITIDPPSVDLDGQAYTMSRHYEGTKNGNYTDLSPGYNYSTSYNGFSGNVDLPLVDDTGEQIGTISGFRDKMAGMSGNSGEGWYLALDSRNTQTGTLAFRPRMVGTDSLNASTKELEIGRFENEVTVTRGGTGTITLDNFNVSDLVTGTYSAILVITVEVGT